MKVCKGYLVVMKDIIENGLYILQGHIVIGSASIVEKDADETIRLWHRRLGHVSEKGLVELEKQGFFGKDKLIDYIYVKTTFWEKLLD